MLVQLTVFTFKSEKKLSICSALRVNRICIRHAYSNQVQRANQRPWINSFIHLDTVDHIVNVANKNL